MIPVDVFIVNPGGKLGYTEYEAITPPVFVGILFTMGVPTVKILEGEL